MPRPVTRDQRQRSTHAIEIAKQMQYLHITVLGNGGVREGAEADARHTESAARASLVELRAAVGESERKTRTREYRVQENEMVEDVIAREYETDRVNRIPAEERRGTRIRMRTRGDR